MTTIAPDHITDTQGDHHRTWSHHPHTGHLTDTPDHFDTQYHLTDRVGDFTITPDHITHTLDHFTGAPDRPTSELLSNIGLLLFYRITQPNRGTLLLDHVQPNRSSFPLYHTAKQKIPSPLSHSLAEARFPLTTQPNICPLSPDRRTKDVRR